MFELQTVEPVEGLEGLGAQVQLRELSYGQMRAALGSAPEASRAGDALLARSLHVDGAPLGLERLDAAPGRFSGAIARAMQRCLALHGMGGEAPLDAPRAAANDAPAEAETDMDEDAPASGEA
jgi:hypothetical protein